MAFKEEYNFEFLKNESENLVINEVELQVQGQEMCLCNDCVVDIVAIALNHVKPLYRCSLLGTIYVSQAMSDKPYADNLRKSVAQAIQKVKANPSHD